MGCSSRRAPQFLVQALAIGIGCHCTSTVDGQAAVQEFERAPSELGILGLIPRLNGAAVCRTIRAKSDVPIIMLTARGDERDRLEGLDMGADDDVTKPFSPRELAARVRAVLRRSLKEAGGGRPLKFDGIEINRERRSVEVQASLFRHRP